MALQKTEEHPKTTFHSRTKQWKVGTLTYTTVGLFTLFFWLLWGDFTWALKDRAVPSVFQLLLKRFDASDMVAGLLLGTVPALFGMLLSPIISYKSDRHRGRLGRRIPFLIVTTPIAFLSMLGLAFSPAIGAFLNSMLGPASPGLHPSILITLTLFWTLWDVSGAAANAVFGGLLSDVVPQCVIGRFLGMFRAASLAAGIIFNYWILGKSENHYVEIFIGVGTLYGVGLMLLCLKVKEGKYPPAPVAIQGESKGLFLATKTYFKECFGKRYYVLYYIALALGATASAPINLFSVFFAQSIGMDMDAYGKCIALTYILSFAMAYPLGVLADRFHPLRLASILVGLYALATLAGGFYSMNTWSFGIALVAHGVINGSYLTASASIGQRLLPNTRFAELSSAGGVLVNLSSLVCAPVMGIFLGYTNHAYRYTFFASSVIAVLALGTYLVLYRQFKVLGGPNNYSAPE